MSLLLLRFQGVRASEPATPRLRVRQSDCTPILLFRSAEIPKLHQTLRADLPRTLSTKLYGRLWTGCPALQVAKTGFLTSQAKSTTYLFIYIISIVSKSKSYGTSCTQCLLYSSLRSLRLSGLWNCHCVSLVLSCELYSLRFVLLNFNINIYLIPHNVVIPLLREK